MRTLVRSESGMDVVEKFPFKGISKLLSAYVLHFSLCYGFLDQDDLCILLRSVLVVLRLFYLLLVLGDLSFRQGAVNQ